MIHRRKYEKWGAVPVFEEHVSCSFAEIVEDAANLDDFGEIHGKIATF